MNRRWKPPGLICRYPDENNALTKKEMSNQEPPLWFGGVHNGSFCSCVDEAPANMLHVPVYTRAGRPQQENIQAGFASAA